MLESMLSKSIDLIDTPNAKDLFDTDRYVADFASVVKETAKISLIGIVGGYGTGKSLMLETYRKNLANGQKWIHIDAWKYPDRKDLWDGFVLDFVSEVNPASFKKVLKKLDGSSKSGKKTAVDAVSSGFKIVMPVFPSDLVGKVTGFMQESPAKRIFQVQAIFEDVIKEVGSDIYIVIEDSDRSGEAGRFFLETLKHYLNTLVTEIQIKVFIPISESSFQQFKEHYVKACDYIQFYEFKPKQMDKFVKEFFCSSILQDEMKLDHVSETLYRLIARNNMSIREIKLLLRNADVRYKSLQERGFKPDARVVLAIESSRFIKSEIGGSSHSSLHTRLKLDKYLERQVNKSFLTPILLGIALNCSVVAASELSRDSSSDYVIQFMDHKRTGSMLAVPERIQGKYSLAETYLY
jgi:hypothetical protein